MGRNYEGQLAINNTWDSAPHPTPVELTALGPGNKDVAASGRVTCVVKDNGDVRCVGNNQNYELGTTQSVPLGTPADVPIGGVDELQAGGSFFCALKGTEVWCWGDNYWWQLGSPAPDPSATPVQVPIDPVKQLAVGHEHVCALLTNDTVICWGNDNHSQLGSCEHGNGQPAQVFLDTNGMVPLLAKQISSTGLATCAIDPQDRAWCWGRNGIYEAGVDNGQVEVCPPAQIALTCN
jgi:alpha-tubulin suppressor-like RCC1 family protein